MRLNKSLVLASLIAALALACEKAQACMQVPVPGDNGWETRPCYYNEWQKAVLGGTLFLALRTTDRKKSSTEVWRSYVIECPNKKKSPRVYVWRGSDLKLTSGCTGEKLPKFDMSELVKHWHPPGTPWVTSVRVPSVTANEAGPLAQEISEDPGMIR